MSNLLPDEALYSLLCKYLLNEADDVSRQWVDAWRKEAPANEEALSAIRRMLEVPHPVAAYPGLSTDESWERLKAAISGGDGEKESERLAKGEHRRPAAEERLVKEKREPSAEEERKRSAKTEPAVISVHRNYRWLKIAAALVLALGLTWLLLPVKRTPQVFAGAQHATLPDGSSVQLFDGAEMKLAAGFGKKERRVEFSGKGAFDIQPDAGAPFVILLGHTEIKVLGTRFTVSYAAGKLLVHVASGKIQVNGGKSVVLTEGMMLRRDDAKEPFTVAEHIPDLDKKQLVFRNVPLENVIRSVEAVYDVRIEAQDSTLLQRGITSNFENETVDNVMAAIAFMTNTSVEKTGERQYTLRP
ncbi:MAG: FecR family protein [Chitinophaga sp.]